MLKFVRSFMMVTFALVLVTACGGSEAPASPAARAEAFFKDFGAAFADTLKTPEEQEKWATTLSEHFVPEARADQKAEILDSLADRNSQPDGKVELKDVVLEETFQEGDVARVKLSGMMVMTIQDQSREIALTGMGNDQGELILRKVDGVWYLEPLE